MVFEEEVPRLSEWLFTFQHGLPAVLTWLLVLLGIAVMGSAFSLLFAVIGRGPSAGVRSVLDRAKEASRDLLSISPRRVFGLSLLAGQEALRRKVVFAALGMFVVILFFAAWFLDVDVPKPARLSLSFVLTLSTYLVLAVALFLSVFSLPDDISSHTIYTVVTKPVRPIEIVLGRILGFSGVGTLMLLIMGTVSYIFVGRVVDHTHQVNGAELRRVKVTDKEDRTKADYDAFQGQTTTANVHRHPFTINIQQGSGDTDVVHGHFHAITEEVVADKTGEISHCAAGQIKAGEKQPAAGPAQAANKQKLIRVTSTAHGLSSGEIIKIAGVKGTLEANDTWVVHDVIDEDTFDLRDSEFVNEYVAGGSWKTTTYHVSGAQGSMSARVAHFAESLHFTSSDGRPGQGTNVGKEWDYRKHIEGGSLARATWRFTGLSREQFPKGLPGEMTLSVYRTHKGDIVSGISGDLVLVNPPATDAEGNQVMVRSKPIPFTAREYETLPFKVPSKWPGKKTITRPDGVVAEIDIEGDLFDDYVSDGVLFVEMSCADRAQYLGMAKHDLYLLPRRGLPAVNFIKGVISIWLRMVLVCAIGVMFSTFLNGFVALLATGALTFGAFQLKFISDIASGALPGGGPLESFYRILTRAAMTTPLEPGVTTFVVQWLDSGIESVLWLVVQVLPDMPSLSDADYVADGFNIPLNTLAVQSFTVLAFVLPLAVLSHYILKGREVAR